jgi:hypothetical protein
MEDMSISYHDATAIGEDKNFAAQIIMHASKLKRNVRHIATKKALQENVHIGRVHFTWVLSVHNLAVHFTKMLPYSILHAHCMTMMGYQFIDAGHLARHNSSLTSYESTLSIMMCQ